MIRLLHLSDTHGERETLVRLNNLARFHEDCEVVALTGDCVSLARQQVPHEWDQWPQKLKLSVPGNHDHAHTFDPLRTWKHQTPWVCRLDDLLFLGIGLSLSESTAECLSSLDWQDARGIVLLSHERPRLENQRLADIVSAFVGSRKLLILHGDEHPNSFPGAEWDKSGLIGASPWFRSNVYSAKSGRRGLCHRILWVEDSFRCVQVQGTLEPVLLDEPIVEHPMFGRGTIRAIDGDEGTERFTIDFPSLGLKKILVNHPGMTLARQ